MQTSLVVDRRLVIGRSDLRGVRDRDHSVPDAAHRSASDSCPQLPFGDAGSKHVSNGDRTEAERRSDESRRGTGTMDGRHDRGP